MTSFAVAIEPAPAPRLACVALAVHAGAAASPWLAHLPPGPAALLTAIALAALVSTLGAVPGAHHPIAELALDGSGCRIRPRGSARWQPAALGPGCRVFADLACLDLRAGGRRFAWVLPRTSVPAGAFRRLKARVRLTC